MIHVAKASEIDRAAVLQLYGEAGYGATLDHADTTIVAKLAGAVVGTVRLCSEHGVIVLRGMQVRAALQRRGTGSQLLAACAAYLDGSPSYCLPYAHLASFYAAAKFECIAPHELPEFLQRRLAAYLAGGRDIIAMRRPKAS